MGGMAQCEHGEYSTHDGLHCVLCENVRLTAQVADLQQRLFNILDIILEGYSEGEIQRYLHRRHARVHGY